MHSVEIPNHHFVSSKFRYLWEYLVWIHDLIRVESLLKKLHHFIHVCTLL